jgi:hypothetical protein
VGNVNVTWQVSGSSVSGYVPLGVSGAFLPLAGGTMSGDINLNENKLVWENPSLGIDTGISRLGPASLAIGDGTAGDASGSLKLATLSVNGGATDSIKITNSDSAPYALIINNLTWGNTDAKGFGIAQRNTGETDIYNNNIPVLSISPTGIVQFTRPVYSTQFVYSASLDGSAILLNNASYTYDSYLGTISTATDVFLTYGTGATNTPVISISGVSGAISLGTSLDASISRIGAASLAIGNGTAGDITGALTLKSLTLSDTTNGTDLILSNTTAATVSTTNASPLLEWSANYWTAGSASAADTWTIGSSLAAGTNAGSQLTIQHSGTSNSTATGVTIKGVCGATTGKNGALVVDNGNNNGGILTLTANSVIISYQCVNSTGYFGTTSNHPLVMMTSNSNGALILDAAGGGTFGALTGTPGNGCLALTGALLAWTAGTGSGTKDTGISRLGAASLAIGNGTAGDYSGSLKLTHLVFPSAGDETWNGDTSISRASANVIQIGNTSGTPDASGTLECATIYAPVSVNPQSTSTNYTAVLADADQLVTTSSAVATFTVPAHATVVFPIGTTLSVAQIGATQVTLTPASGAVTINTPSSLTTRAQYSTVSVVLLSDNGTNTVWLAMGDLT